MKNTPGCYAAARRSNCLMRVFTDSDKNLGCALEDLVATTLAFNNAESRVKA